MKHHPGDWLWIIAGGRFVALTPEAFARARALGFDETPDAWEELRARGGTMGDYMKAALDVLEHSGAVRVEMRDAIGRENFRWPVYALVPPEERAEPVQSRPKRVRRKRTAAAEPPALVLVQGGASD